MKKLDNLKWSPMWVSHLGCVKGCLDYLGIEISEAWLYGGTGHAFIINISMDSCPSGPTAWKTMMLFQQAPYLGYEVEGVFGSKYQKNLNDLQREAWDFTRKAIDEGLPIFAWEVDIPEFYVIYGYDDIGYYYSGPEADNGKGPKPWDEFGDTGIGLVEMYRVKPVEAKPPIEVVKSALEKVLKHASNPEEWIFENYASGLKGFDLWIDGLESGIANRFGMGYNAAVWYTCRKNAVGFLKEAKSRLQGDLGELFDESASHYQIVAENLEKVSKAYPWTPEGGPKTIPMDEPCKDAVGWLKEARGAEESGLGSLKVIVDSL
jgi:hypothetical protein